MNLAEAIQLWNNLDDVTKLRIICYAGIPGILGEYVRAHAFEHSAKYAAQDLYWGSSTPIDRRAKEAVVAIRDAANVLRSWTSSDHDLRWVHTEANLARMMLVGADMTSVLPVLARMRERQNTRDS